jgi:hypothetical protein
MILGDSGKTKVVAVVKAGERHTCKLAVIAIAQDDELEFSSFKRRTCLWDRICD